MELDLVLGSAAVVLSALILWWAVTGRHQEAMVDLRAHDLAPGATERAAAPLHRFGGWLHGFLPSDRTAAIERKISSAGNPPGWTVERVISAKVLLPTFLGLLLLVRFLGSPSWLNFLLLAVAVVGGFFVPDALIDAKVSSRQQAVRDEVAEVIDQLGVMVRAGLSVDAAIVRCARSNDGPMAEELTRVVQDMRVGVSRATALANMAERMDIPELRAFVAALSQADQLGVPVTETLRVQAVEMRTKQRQLAEEQAMKLPVKILFPMVLCILPVIFIVLLGPAAIRIFEELG